MQNRIKPSRIRRGFYQEWMILLAIIMLAAGLRLWRLADAPLGLYHDEAYNGLDALKVLDGWRPFFFPANNGREPLFIYTVALSVGQFGRTTFALRLPAAIFGTLSVIPFYFLTKHWIDRQTATFAAFIWATTVWPIHLSRLGFRTVLLPFFLVVAAYLLTISAEKITHKKPAHYWLLAAGLVYGLAFYSYLAARLSLIGLLVFIGYLWLIHRPPRLLQQGLWFGGGLLIAVAPLFIALASIGELFGGRAGDVSILNAAMNDGALLRVLGENFGRTVGMFFWHGDTIARHNPIGRPVFDWLMTLPFLFGVGWSVRNWRQPAVAALLIWVIVMLTGTLFAEDAPHFLRAVGILPVLLIFPAIGLSHLWNWSKLPTDFRKTAVSSRLLTGALLLGSSIAGINDYFVDFAGQPETGYMFEAAASSLAQHALADLDAGTEVWLDRQFPEQWQAIPFLLPATQVVTFTRDILLSDHAVAVVEQPTSLYVWPYERHDFVPRLIPDGAVVQVRSGELTRLDSQTQAYPLYINYKITPGWEKQMAGAHKRVQTANFDNLFDLWVSAEMITPQQLAIELIWSAQNEISASLVAFVHVIDQNDGTLVGQLDAPPGTGSWQVSWWKPDIFVAEERIISLPVHFDAQRHTLVVGIYDVNNDNERLPRLDNMDRKVSDSLELTVESGTK